MESGKKIKKLFDHEILQMQWIIFFQLQPFPFPASYIQKIQVYILNPEYMTICKIFRFVKDQVNFLSYP